MAGLKDLYLIAYNLACCSGWAGILYVALPVVVGALLTDPATIGQALASVYATADLADVLFYVQTAALLEIVHAALGLVRSPVVVTALQVGSRIAALFAITRSPDAQAQFGAGLMILSWALVEVPRYLFYVFAIVSGDATKKTPFPLFWLRYSLFAVLYPTGITGELTVFLAAAKDSVFLNAYGEQYARAMYYFIMSFPVIYAPGALPMILNMAANRRSAFKKRFAKPPPPPKAPVGAEFPEDGKGGRSTSEAGKKVIAAAFAGAGDTDAQLACVKFAAMLLNHGTEQRTGLSMLLRGPSIRPAARARWPSVLSRRAPCAAVCSSSTSSRATQKAEKENYRSSWRSSVTHCHA